MVIYLSHKIYNKHSKGPISQDLVTRMDIKYVDMLTEENSSSKFANMDDIYWSDLSYSKRGWGNGCR